MTPATAVMDQIADRFEATNIFDRAVCLSLELRRLGTKRKMNVRDLQPGVTTDDELIHVSKDILDSEALDAIKKHDGAIRRYLEAKVSGPALFRSGVYMISYDLTVEVDRELTARLTEREEVLIPAFMAEYVDCQNEAKRRLGPHFSAADYPDRDTVRAQFGAQVRYFTLGDPKGLERISPEIFEREKAKAADQWATVLEESRNVLRAEMAELVDHMIDRLQPDATGKKKRFNASTIENLDEFLKSFSARNIADDADLTRVVEEARAALKGVTPERIRDYRSVRQDVRGKFEAVKAEMDRLVVVAGARRGYDLD